MQARTLLKHLRWTPVLFVFLVTACVATSRPRIRACAAAGGSAASEGVLRILSSTVPGVEIDSAYWRTGAGTEDIGAWEQLGYHSRLRAHRTVRRNELAIIYEPGDSAMTLDADVSAVPGRLEMLNHPDSAHVDLHAGDTTTTAWFVRLGGGFRVGKWSAARYCSESGRRHADPRHLRDDAPPRGAARRPR
jgi:hypothetical protein